MEDRPPNVEVCTTKVKSLVKKKEHKSADLEAAVRSNDLLLNSNRGAGGLVVSKEEGAIR
jgi:hypothetical protein